MEDFALRPKSMNVNQYWHSFYLDSGLIIRKNIRYRLSRLPKAPEGQGLDSLYLIFKT